MVSGVSLVRSVASVPDGVDPVNEANYNLISYTSRLSQFAVSLASFPGSPLTPRRGETVNEATVSLQAT